MNEENGVVESVPAMSSVRVPIYALRGALSCVADEDTMKHLGGVYLHRFDGSIRVAATDGTRLFVASFDEGEAPPDWLVPGIIIPGAALKPRLSFLNTLKEGIAVVSFASGAPKVALSNLNDDTVFRMEPISGSFPDYQTAVIDKAIGVFTREVATDFQATGYSAGNLKNVGAMAKILDSEFVRVFASSEREPSVVTFDKAPGVVLYIMPSKISTPLAPQTAKLLEGPIKGTIAALKAHQTRWQQRLDELPMEASEGERHTIQQKIGEYEQRIANVIAAANPPALPSPLESFRLTLRREMADLTFAVYETLVEGWFEAGLTIDQAMAEAQRLDEEKAEADPHVAVAEERAGLSSKKRKAANREFLKDIRLSLAGQNIDGNHANAREIEDRFVAGHSIDEVVAEITASLGIPQASSDQLPGTLDAFATEVDAILSAKFDGDQVMNFMEGVPLSDWFDAGVTPAEAAERCQEWRVEEPEPPARPEHIGDFVEAVMSSLTARFGAIEKPLRRKVTATVTQGFGDGKDIAEVVATICAEYPERFPAEPAEAVEPQPESVVYADAAK